MKILSPITRLEFYAGNLLYVFALLTIVWFVIRAEFDNFSQERGQYRLDAEKHQVDLGTLKEKDLSHDEEIQAIKEGQQETKRMIETIMKMIEGAKPPEPEKGAVASPPRTGLSAWDIKQILIESQAKANQP